MDPTFVAIEYHQPLWLGIALLSGLAMQLIGLPPLVGFLAAGFVLYALGARGGEFLQQIADLGVTLLLFSIGLKLKLRSLFKPEIWGPGIGHMLLISVFGAGGLLLLAGLGLGLFAELNLYTAALAAFALSFSSTVFAVKTLEDKGASASRYGRVAVGVLILQDVAAVLFVASSSGMLPSPWALALPVLLVLRGPLHQLLKQVGHGELQILLGFVLALGGAAVFEAVNLRGDLGALAAGLLLSGHAKADELSRSLMGFKELFLVGFFLSIGLTGLPTLEETLIAVSMLLLIPFKTALFVWLFTRFRLTSRTSSYSALALSNYSEFGLIISAVAAQSGWMSGSWLLIMAMTVSLSFVLAAPLNKNSERVYSRFSWISKKWEHPRRLPEDKPVDVGEADTIVFGVGRVGTAVYDHLEANLGSRIIGIDYDKHVVEKHRRRNRNVMQGDVSNPDFWSGLFAHQHGVKRVILAMPSHVQQMVAVQQLRKHGFSGQIAATAKYRDHVGELKRNGVEGAFDIYREAGTGFAEHVLRLFGEHSKDTVPLLTSRMDTEEA